jgi:transcriptional regulator with XRE-family HTH domain
MRYMATVLSSEQEILSGSSELTEIGQRIRSFRQSRGWTLEALGSRSNLSKSYISRLEDGDRQPSIAALLSISRALGLSVGALLNDTSDQHNVSVVRGAETPSVPGNGLIYQPHNGGFPGATMQPMRITISAGRTGNELYKHDGEEWLYVLSGRLAATIGDSIHFDATVGHRLNASDEKDVDAILVASICPKALLSSYM